MKREEWNSITKQILNEELTENEHKWLEGVSDDAEIMEARETLDKVDTYYQLKKFDTNAAWDKVGAGLDKSKSISLYKRVMQIAAAFIILIATGVAVWQFSNNLDQQRITTAQYDLSHPEVILPDGTKVILSRDSKLVYPKTFENDERKVSLEGEAFFDVTADSNRPFVIETGNAAVRVLGTSFNVNAYTQNSQVEVFVKTGKVELINGDPDNALADKVVLLPGEKGIFSKLDRNLLKATPENENSLAWITREIEFKFTALDEVIVTLENTYGITIEYDDQVDLSVPLNATFTKQNKDFVMEIVAKTLDLELEKKNEHTYYIQK